MRVRLSIVVRVAVLAAICGLSAFAAVPTSAQNSPDARPIRLMTRNLYLGGDIAPVAAATSLPDLAARVAQLFTTVQATDFPARAKVLAREVRDADPTLIGLQEVSLWRKGPPGVLDGPATPATTVVYDFLQSLQTELAALGLQYTAVVVQSTVDAEAPSALGFDVRLTQRNAILVKGGIAPADLTLSNVTSGLYATFLNIPTVAGPIADRRGWTAVDVTANRRTFRFINTHLDSTVPGIRAAQANELVSGPANTALPVVLVGDLNSGPGEPAPSAYTNLLSAGFDDSWTQANRRDPGLTCCHAENLLNPTPTFTTRLDHVLTYPRLKAIHARLVGVDPANRTPAGLWPSDHAGIVATLLP
jgi:endonuclease/exonuclease/phosphatase family metal-dependent hydrolase